MQTVIKKSLKSQPGPSSACPRPACRFSPHPDGPDLLSPGRAGHLLSGWADSRCSRTGRLPDPGWAGLSSMSRLVQDVFQVPDLPSWPHPGSIVISVGGQLRPRHTAARDRFSSASSSTPTCPRRWTTRPRCSLLDRSIRRRTVRRHTATSRPVRPRLHPASSTSIDALPSPGDKRK